MGFEIAASMYYAEKESEANEQGSYSYFTVETTYPYYLDQEYSATIVGNYEVYTEGTTKQITDYVIYSKGGLC